MLLVLMEDALLMLQVRLLLNFWKFTCCRKRKFDWKKMACLPSMVQTKTWTPAIFMPLISPNWHCTQRLYSNLPLLRRRVCLSLIELATLSQFGTCDILLCDWWYTNTRFLSSFYLLSILHCRHPKLQALTNISSSDLYKSERQLLQLHQLSYKTNCFVYQRYCTEVTCNIAVVSSDCWVNYIVVCWVLFWPFSLLSVLVVEPSLECYLIRCWSGWSVDLSIVRTFWHFSFSREFWKIY